MLTTITPADRAAGQRDAPAEHFAGATVVTLGALRRATMRPGAAALAAPLMAAARLMTAAATARVTAAL